jgi:CRP-like cAMP-binding protein
MRSTAATSLLAALPATARERLNGLAKDVSFPAGTRIFEDGGMADRFWIIHTGSVVLDVPVPGRRPAPVEILRTGDLVGCSWLFPPYTWHMGAEAQSAVRAQEFDATVVRALSRADLEFGEALARRVAEIIAHRMQSARIRLLDLYGPLGSGRPQ